MFSRIVRKIKKERSQLRILVLGLDNAGKTTILHRILHRPVSRIAPTFGYQIHDAVYNGLNLQILDVGGQALFREYWTNYYEKTDGIVFVFDSSDSRSFVGHIGDIRTALVDTPVLVLANKCDLSPAFEPCVLGDDFCRFLESCPDMRLVRCSGATGEGLEDGFRWIVDMAVRSLAK